MIKRKIPPDKKNAFGAGLPFSRRSHRFLLIPEKIFIRMLNDLRQETGKEGFSRSAAGCVTPREPEG
jgi:hypothetical protein